MSVSEHQPVGGTSPSGLWGDDLCGLGLSHDSSFRDPLSETRHVGDDQMGGTLSRGVHNSTLQDQSVAHQVRGGGIVRMPHSLFERCTPVLPPPLPEGQG